MKQSGFPGLLKRAVDVTGAVLGLALGCPAMLGTAIAVRLSMGRPVLFRQERPGLHGRTFVLLKFRTMHNLVGEDGEPLSDRARLTRTGKWIRRLSLDELPQLINVLRGDLSLVGPRPLLVQYLPLYSARQARRHDVMPGITGWAQVHGRNSLGWPERLELDVWYADNWSLLLDVKILVLTARQLLAMQDIGHEGHETMPSFEGNVPRAVVSTPSGSSSAHDAPGRDRRSMNRRDGSGVHRPVLVHCVTVPMTFHFLEGLLSYLDQGGFDVHCVASGRPPQNLSGEPVTWHNVPMERRMSLSGDGVALLRLAALFRRLRPQIVQAGTPKAGLLGTLAARAAGVPICIYHVRGLASMSADRRSGRLAYASEFLAVRAATHVLSVSHSVATHMAQHHICPSWKSRVLLGGSSNGVEATSRFNPDRFSAASRSALKEELGLRPTGLVLGFVGRLVRDKGLVDLERAWRTLREAIPELELLLVGPFEKGDALPPNTRRTLESDPRVHVTETALGEAARMYSIVDVLAFPSYREGFPNVPLEAAAMGVPSVVYDVVGSRDSVVSGVTGRVVRAHDVSAFAAAVLELLKDPNLRAQFGAQARSSALTDFDRPRLWAAYLDYYQELLRESG